MLADFIVSNRSAIISLAHARLAARSVPKPTEAELTTGIPLFVDQLGAALRRAETSDVIDHQQIGKSATLYGEERLALGLTVGQVVHDYGDVCQAITELAVDKRAPIPTDEFQSLNLCLDDAIAEAVTGFARGRESVISERGSERLRVLANDLRNLLNTAMISFESIRSGRVAASGSTGIIHQRSLMGLRDVVDRSLAEVYLEIVTPRRDPIPVSELLEEIEIGALGQATSLGFRFAVRPPADRTVTVEGDRPLLAAAVASLLQHAFGCTREHGSITLRARAAGDRVLFEVEDECDGLPREIADLPIAREVARANGGGIRVENTPGRGCIYILELPRKAPRPSGARAEPRGTPEPSS